MTNQHKTVVCWGWSDGAMVLSKLLVPGRPTILISVGQGSTALAVGAGGGCLDIFTLIYPFSSLSPSLWETARYRLKYCLKGPLNQKQATNRCLFNSHKDPPPHPAFGSRWGGIMICDILTCDVWLITFDFWTICGANLNQWR